MREVRDISLAPMPSTYRASGDGGAATLRVAVTAPERRHTSTVRATRREGRWTVEDPLAPSASAISSGG